MDLAMGIVAANISTKISRAPQGCMSVPWSAPEASPGRDPPAAILIQ
jgi:hypothetical protein